MRTGLSSFDIVCLAALAVGFLIVAVEVYLEARDRR